MPSAMIILKNTARSVKLIPADEINQTHFKPLMRSNEMCERVGEVMEFAMGVIRHNFVYRPVPPTLKEVYDAMIAKYGDNWFSDVKFLPKTGSIPARLLVVKK